MANSKPAQIHVETMQQQDFKLDQDKRSWTTTSLIKRYFFSFSDKEEKLPGQRTRFKKIGSREPIYIKKALFVTEIVVDEEVQFLIDQPFRVPYPS